MSLANLLYLYRRRLRARLVQELLALAGVAAGVALLFAVQVSNTSLTASIAQLTSGLVGDAQLELVARDPHGFDERLAERVAHDADVRAAAPVLMLQANAVGPHGEQPVMLVGADRRLVSLGGDLLSGFGASRFAGLDAAVLPATIAEALDVHFGNGVTLDVAGRVVRVPVGAIVERREVGPLADAPAIVVPLAYAQRIAGLPGRVTRVFAVARDGRERAVAATLRELAGRRLDVTSTSFD